MPSLTDELAGVIIRQLEKPHFKGRPASLVVPGGSSPVPLFQKLSHQALDWKRVFITLSDERWVRVRDASSNERLLREHLLRNAAAAAHYVGLKSFTSDVDAGARKAWQRIEVVPRPFDIVVLGMGEDGHFASLFAGDPAAARGLDPAQPPGCVAVRAPAQPSQRVSLNLSALLHAHKVVLLATGDTKWKLIQQERVRDTSKNLPVRQLMMQQRVPVEIYWAP